MFIAVLPAHDTAAPWFPNRESEKRRDVHSWIKLTQNFVPAVKSECVHAHRGQVREQGEEGRNLGMRGWRMTRAPQLPTVHCDWTQCGGFYIVVL